VYKYTKCKGGYIVKKFSKLDIIMIILTVISFIQGILFLVLNDVLLDITWLLVGIFMALSIYLDKKRR
jgi:hypothetical protein